MAYPENGSGRVVLATNSHRNANELLSLSLDSGTTIEATERHRIFSVDRGAWTAAAELTVGETLLGAEGYVHLERVGRKPGTFLVYNIEVETRHTYLVSKRAILVHNACPTGGAGGPSTKVTSGPSRSPKQGAPNSINEQLDPSGKVMSRTFYDENGNPFSRQDFDHSHAGMKPHEHSREFNSQGQPITPEDVHPLPPGYDKTPTKP